MYVHLFQSHVRNDYYFSSYTIEPMLELLLTEESTHQNTRYKVLFPITTPLMPHSPQVTDREFFLFLWSLFLLLSCIGSGVQSFYPPLTAPTDTIPEQRLFKVLLGPLGADVALVNITFPSEVLSVADCSIRGFKVLEHMSPDSSSKYFSLQVPFQDQVVQQTVRICLTNWGHWFNFSLDQEVNLWLPPPQQKELGRTIFSLHLTFGLLVLPEFAPFSLSAHLDIGTNEDFNSYAV